MMEVTDVFVFEPDISVSLIKYEIFRWNNYIMTLIKNISNNLLSEIFIL